MPYLVGAAGWGLYIRQAPHDFILQFGGNAAGRGGEAARDRRVDEVMTALAELAAHERDENVEHYYLQDEVRDETNHGQRNQ